MPINALTITGAGAVGWLGVEDTVFNDPANPTVATISLFYRVSGDQGQNPLFVDVNTADTQANIRSICKDAIKADILTTYGVTIAKSAIKMSNSLE